MTEPRQQPTPPPGEQPVQISWVGTTPPAPTGSPPPDRRRTWIVLAAAAVVVIVAITVLAVKLLDGDQTTPSTDPTSTAAQPTRGPSTAEPSPTPVPTTPAPDPGAEQAGSLDRLLDVSATARRGVQPAINNIDQCRSSSADRRALRRAEDRRRTLVSTLGGTDLSELPGGSGRSLAASLRRAWTASADADAEYLAWERAVRSCSGVAVHEGHYDRAFVLSERATAAKKAFVQEWNPIARQYGLPTRQSIDI